MVHFMSTDLLFFLFISIGLKLRMGVAMVTWASASQSASSLFHADSAVSFRVPYVFTDDYMPVFNLKNHLYWLHSVQI